MKKKARKEVEVAFITATVESAHFPEVQIARLAGRYEEMRETARALRKTYSKNNDFCEGVRYALEVLGL